MEINIPDHIRFLLKKINFSGYKAYCVGGCVRDCLIGQIPHDWDIASSATPEDIMSIFDGYKTINTGIKHGTVTLLLDGNPVEITTFRKDGKYSDFRHPDSVSFSDQLKDDLSRRDFTINSMAIDIDSVLNDPYCGSSDLNNKIIRCVGDPEKRFTEDPLRILRALRFSSRLAFDIEKNTEAAIFSKFSLLENISIERIQAELSGILVGQNAESTLRKYSEVIFFILPELRVMYNCPQETKYHKYDVWEHTLHSIGFADQDINLRLCMLFHDSGKPALKTFEDNGVAHFYKHEYKSAEITEHALRRLRYPNNTVENVSKLVRMHSIITPLKDLKVKRMISEHGYDFFFDLMKIKTYDTKAQSDFVLDERLPGIEKNIFYAKTLQNENACLSLKELAVSGDDLIREGFSSGKNLGTVLNELLDLVITGNAPNDKVRLIKIAKRRLEK